MTRAEATNRMAAGAVKSTKEDIESFKSELKHAHRGTFYRPEDEKKEKTEWQKLMDSIKDRNKDDGNPFVVWRKFWKQAAAFAAQDQSPEPLHVFSFEVFCRALKEKFEIDVQDSEWLEMDSSTEKKFSRHVVVNLGKAVWKNNVHCGRFVAGVCSKIRIKWLEMVEKMLMGVAISDPERKEWDDLKDLVISKSSSEGSEPHLFVDEGVYTRNRNFRILFSTKLGKNAPLIAVKPAWKKIDDFDQKHFEKFLVSSVAFFPKLRVLSVDGADSSANSMKPGEKGGIGGTGAGYGAFDHGDERSPFWKIDGYVLGWIKRNCGQGARAQKVNYFPDSKTIVYGIIGTRFCFNIGREHKSNGVYYVAELTRGHFSQRCHDPDCKYFRSHEESIPIEFNPFREETDVKDGVRNRGDLTEDEEEVPLVKKKRQRLDNPEGGDVEDEDVAYDDGGVTDDALLKAAANIPETKTSA
ncbi:hypothetical protein HDU97_008234 [Phlyctochytrium planicorne]|nr:hypothetical protein HDU97_008234 [Phlyctochytrium planicorne]